MRMKALFHKRVHGKEADVFFYYDIAEIPNISAVAFSSILSHIQCYFFDILPAIACNELPIFEVGLILPQS